MRASGKRPERICNGEAAVIVAVPVHANFFSAGPDDFADDELHEVVSTLRYTVADGVAEDDGARSVANGGGVEAFDGAGIGANGVFGDVHRGEAVLDGKLDGVFRGAFEVVNSPIFDEAANGAGTEKCCGFDGNPSALRNFHDGTNVIFNRARSTIGLDAHAICGDFAGERFGVFVGAGASARKADVDGIEAERFHEVKDFNFFSDRRVVDGRVLQTVAERFVI